jgi:hypothetical protein
MLVVIAVVRAIVIALPRLGDDAAGEHAGERVEAQQ